MDMSLAYTLKIRASDCEIDVFSRGSDERINIKNILSISLELQPELLLLYEYLIQLSELKMVLL